MAHALLQPAPKLQVQLLQAVAGTKRLRRNRTCPEPANVTTTPPELPPGGTARRRSSSSQRSCTSGAVVKRRGEGSPDNLVNRAGSGIVEHDRRAAPASLTNALPRRRHHASRYHRFKNYRLPREPAERKALVATVGRDGFFPDVDGLQSPSEGTRDQESLTSLHTPLRWKRRFRTAT